MKEVQVRTLRECILRAWDGPGFEVWAEKIDGQFTPESRARFGQAQFPNGGADDDMVLFMRLDRLSFEVEALGWVAWAEESPLNEDRIVQTIINQRNRASETSP